ncbi:Crp/Fnr family transcriptional regulator [Leptospira bouyouniensis]|uniref:Crp/Fnr family transcriptional regulator n=1 Tax=Leptospira bouyouniensis TaxID=2484911 RepID=A0A7I0HW18_9LEPT|nr:Crp/Fnr family transcriptional regulator [Leptospira bouyouniensis]TGL08487.1 Crp/Fnr family transcriptional regulator [Leptospira bouyouniensis]
MIKKYITNPSPESLLKAFSGCKELSFEKDEFLFHSGDDVAYMDLLVNGDLQVFKYDGNLNEVTLTFFRPVSIIAEWAVIQGIPYPASARFTKTSTIIRMPLIEVQTRLNSNIELNHILMHSLMNKIETLNLAINRGLTMDAMQRVAHFLFYGTPDSLALKQTQMASLLYLRPETFSRILKQLKDQGLVDTQRGEIKILDKEGLLKILA